MKNATKCKSANVHVRLNQQLKTEATDILNNLGLSVSEFIKLSFIQVVQDKTVQFELKLMADDKPEMYTEAQDMNHLKKLIKYKGDA